MADQEITLLEAAKLETPSYATGLIGTYAEAYPNFGVAPIVPSDRIYSWDVEDDLPDADSTVGSRYVGSDFDATQGNVKPYSSELKAYGGKIMVDEYIQDNMSKSVATQELMQVKSFARKAFVDTFEGAGGKNFRGVRDWLAYDSAFAASQVVNASGSSQAVIDLDMLDDLLERVIITPGTRIYSNPIVLRKITQLCRGNVSAGYNVVYPPNGLGMPIETYRGVPMVPCSDGKNANLLSVVEPDYATTATSCSLYVITWGSEGALYHSSNPASSASGVPMPTIIRSNPGTNYNYTRFKYYLGFAPTALRCIGRIRYLKNAMS
jgi:hypothetical protein